MSFGGRNAMIMILLLVVLVLAVTKLDLPGWILPVGLVAGGGILKGIEKRATT